MELKNYNELNYLSKDLENKIKKAIELSTGVYAYRSLNHFPQKTDLIKWVAENANHKLKTFEIFYPEYNKTFTIKSSDNSYIYFLEFNEENKKQFLQMFKVSVRDVVGAVDFNIETNDFFVDDSIYGQFDFIFVNDDEIILKTNIHPFIFNYNDKII